MQMPQIVIDTSVLLAGLRSSRGQAFRSLQLVGAGRFKLNLSVPLVIEYESVLLRELPNHPVPPSVVDDVINVHCAVANRHQMFFLWRSCLRDPQDDMVLDLAVKARCDAMVTSHQRDVVGVEETFQLRVVAPGEFLKDIGASTMGTLSIRPPDSLHLKVRQLAERDGISINQFIATAVAEKLAALITEESIEERAKHGSRATYEAALTQVPAVEPEAYDRRAGT